MTRVYAHSNRFGPFIVEHARGGGYQIRNTETGSLNTRRTIREAREAAHAQMMRWQDRQRITVSRQQPPRYDGIRLVREPHKPMMVQCAWCHKIQDADGQYTITADHNYMGGTVEHPTTTHGICPPCGEEFLKGLAA